jgi:hypothetical protein
MSNFSRNNAPADGPFWSIACETSSKPEEEVDPAALIAWAERAMRVSFLPPGQTIVSRWYRRLSYGYPLPCLKRDQFLQEVQPGLRRSGILARGRFGGWKYETSNQDNAFMQGVEAVDSVLFGTEEISYFHLDEVSKGSVKRRLSDWEPRVPWLHATPRSVA